MGYCVTDGNLTRGPLSASSLETYAYDARNRLTAAGGTTYRYDPVNNRIGQTDSNGTTTYTIDSHGDALPRVLVRTKPDGSITRYVYGIGLLYEVDDSDAATYYHYNQSGSTIALTDVGGAVTDRVEYSPFGTITHREGTTDTPYLYVGQLGIQTDANGLLHMRARYYNPLIRRFINADPTGFDGGLNWYQYANNSPLLYVDANGEHPVLVALFHVGRIAVTAAYRYAAPIVARAAVRSGAAIASGARISARATARFARQTATQARQAAQTGLNRLNFSTYRANQTLRNPSPAVRSAVKFGLYSSAAGGLANEFSNNPINTSGLTGVNFGPSPLGATIAVGVQAFDAGGGIGRLSKAAYNSVGSYLNNFRQTFRTPSFSTPSFGGSNFNPKK